MKKTANLLLSVVVLLTLALSFYSCSKDEEKKVAEVTFQTLTQSVDEDQGTLLIPYEIENGPTDADAIISFSFSGTATEDEDYTFVGWNDDGLVVDIIDDNDTEASETIIITMTSGEDVNIGEPDTHTVTILGNDDDTDLTIDLTWDAGSGTPGNVDMDLILWVYNPGTDDFTDIDGSLQFGTAFESVTLLATEPDATYGLTYQYYEGSSNNLTFTVTFTTTDGTLEGTEHELSFSETYTLNNVNATSNVFIEQLFDKTGTDYNNFSDIDVPTSGSRMKTFSIPGLKQRIQPENNKPATTHEFVKKMGL